MKRKTWEEQVGMEEENKNYRWLCYPCGKRYFYIGQIAGMVIKRCENCGIFNRVLYRFDVAKNAQAGQEEIFIRLGERV